MNDSLIQICIITKTEGTILSAHCRGCKAGLAESCSHIASVVFYLEARTKTALSLIPEYANSYVVKSHTIPTISDHFNQKCRDLTYPELLKFCFQTKYHKLDRRVHLVLSFSRDFFSQHTLTLLLFLACSLFLDCPLPSLKSLFKIQCILFLLVSKV